MQLYNIDEQDVEELVRTKLGSEAGIEGRVEVVDSSLQLKYRYPLKVVFVVEGIDVEVVTSYPLKGTSGK